MLDDYQENTVKALAVLGMKQVEIAEIFGVPQSTVSEIVRSVSLGELRDDVRKWREAGDALLAQYKDRAKQEMHFVSLGLEPER